MRQNKLTRLTDEELAAEVKFELKELVKETKATETSKIEFIKELKTGLGSEMKQKGGAQKTIGNRNLVFKKSKKNTSSINYESYYNSDSEHGNNMSNELSRLIQNRKEELHNEVLNMILEMLNKGTLSIKSKVVEANEKNAKLIKAVIYRKISEKNPQLK